MSILGLEKGTVRLAPHDERWHQLFEEEQERLRRALGVYAPAIEHVGSTAVCGLYAKPIIDLAVGVRELADVAKCVVPLEVLGYVYRGEQGIPGRHFFGRGEPRTHNLHLVELNGERWRSQLLFRDYLRQHREVSEKYEQLKQELAEQYGQHRAAYTDGKAAFIEAVLKAAGESGASV